MAALTLANRQSILNKVFSGFIIKNQAVSCSIADLFDWIGCLDHLPGHDFVDQLSGSPEFASSLFNLDDDSGLDSDDLAFLIDLDAAHSAAIDTAKVRKYYRGLSCSLCELDIGIFRIDLGQRLDQIATDEGLYRPALALSAA